MQTIHGEPVYYDYSRIETFNFCDYADKPEPPSIESRLNIAEWQVAGLEKIIKELKDRLTKLESGV
jgi:isocitrate dehydrogenase kinase/phosphatase